MKFEEHLLDVMRTESGRKVLAHFIEATGYRRTDVPEKIEGHFHLRNFGARMEATIKQVDFDLYLKMLKEEHDNG